MSRLLRFLAFVEALFFFLFYLIPPLLLYNHFQLQNFDYGIFFQSIGVVGAAIRSGGGELFLSTRGVHTLADNQEHFQVLLSLLGFLPGSHYWLLAAQATAVWSCGFVVLWVLRGEAFVAFCMASVVWLSPLLININIDVLHTEAFATVFLLLGFVFARAGQSIGFAAALLLAALCKEDVAITVATFCALGLWKSTNFKLPRKVWLSVGVVATAIFLGNLFIVLPHYKIATCEWLDSSFSASNLDASPVAPFFRNTLSRLFDLSFYGERLGRPIVWEYLLRVNWPLLFVFPWASVFWLMPFPALFVNIIAETDYLVQGHFHYDHSTFAAVVVALLLSLERSAYRKHIAFAILSGVLSQHGLRDSSLRLPVQNIASASLWEFKKDGRVVFLEELKTALPEDAVISADYVALNYLLQGKRQVYMWENPFRRESFGIYGLCETFVNRPVVDVVVLRVEAKISFAARGILANSYELILEEEGIQVFTNRFSRRGLDSKRLITSRRAA